MKRLAKKPFVILGINSDRDRKALKAVMEKEKITWRSWWDGGSTNGPIARKWNVRGWPTLYIIDHKGVIRLSSVGSPGNEVLDKTINELVALAEKDANGKQGVKK